MATQIGFQHACGFMSQLNDLNRLMLKSEAVQVPNSGFKKNIRSIASMWLAVPSVSHSLILGQRASNQAAFNCLGHLPATKQEESNPEIMARITTEHGKVWKEFESQGLMGARAASDASVHIAGLIDRMIESHEDSFAREGIQAMLSAMLVSGWTAFEVMAEDLWISALNARPRLGLLAMNAAPETTDDPDELERKRTVSIPFTAGMLSRPDFDATKSIGTAISQKWNFARREGAVDAYVKAFGSADGGRVKPILNDDALIWINTIRNCLVHDAGVLDSQRKKQLRNHPQLRNLNVGDTVPMSGELVSTMISGVIRQGSKLLAFVDEWMENNQA